MRKVAMLLFSMALAAPTFALSAQDVTGAWHGVLDVMGTRLRLVFHVSKSGSDYSSTLDSPDQGATGIPVTATTLKVSNVDSTLRFELANINAVFVGNVGGDSVTGTWTQGMNDFPLVLARTVPSADLSARNRPQEPVRPYPYRDEEVSFRNEDAALTLAGTLTLPVGPGPHPAVVLISGSGPQNRDEEVFGHRPFLVLADYLTRQGIAVLRYDDRGIGGSTGRYEIATSRDFATDAAAAVKYLSTRPEIDHARIGLVGHSEGALIAPMVSAMETSVDFIVLLAGTGVPGREISLMQARTLRMFPVTDEAAYERFTARAIEIASSNADLATKRRELTRHYESITPVLESMLPAGTDVDAFIALQVAESTRPWHQFFLAYDPATDLAKLTVPVLSLHGGRDLQVPPAMNQPGIRRALERSALAEDDYVIKTLPGLNHMFQESETGAMQEYPTLEQTFAPSALTEISEWILRTVK